MNTLWFLFYNNNFMIYLIFLSDFNNLKLDKILENFYLVTMSVLYIKPLLYITKLNLYKISDV